MLRSCTDVNKPQFCQQSGDRTLGIDNTETLLDDALQIDPAPPDHAVGLGIGTGLDDGSQLASEIPPNDSLESEIK